MGLFGFADYNSAARFKKPKWQLRKISKCYKNLYTGVFSDADYESAVKFWKFQIAVPI